MAVSHSAANMTPSAYIAGTTTPVAITATWSTVPATIAQPDHDHLEDQDGRAQAPHGSPPALAPSGPPPASTSAAPSSSRASPAVVVEPVMRIPAPPGPGPSEASSASAVAMSIASSSRAAATTRSGPNTPAA